MAIDRGAKELRSPDQNYILDLQTELADSFRQQDQDIDDMRAVREMRVPAMGETDSRYSLVSVDPRDPDITEEAWQQTAILTLERPKLSIVGGEGDTAQTVASKLEHWTEQVLWQCGTRGVGADTMTQVTDACLNDGGGWAKLLWAADLWDARYAVPSPSKGETTDAYQQYDKLTEEAKKRAGPPFIWSYVDPRTIYPQRSGGMLEEVIEVSEMTLRHAFRKYRLGRNHEGDIVPEELGSVTLPNDSNSLGTRDPLATVQFVEHWDKTWVTYLIGGRNFSGHRTGQIVKQFRHKYGFVPYDYAPGLTMSWMRDRKVGWGIGRTKLWLVKYRQYLRAMHAQYVARDLLSPLVTYGDTPAAAVGTGDGLPREQTDLSLHPGEILNLPPGRQLQRIEYADASTLEKHMGLIDTAIRELESPHVTTLSGMEGAGFAISQVLSYARTRTGPIRHGLEALLHGQTEKLWSLVRDHPNINEKVWVFYGGREIGSEKAATEFIGFGPDDLKRPMHISWSVQSELPTDEMLKVRTATERINNQTFGLDEAVAYLGDNPDEIRRSRMRDKIRESPAYQKYLMAEVFQNAGRGDLLEKAQQAEQLALQGQVGQPQLPPGGPGPGVFEGGGPGIPSVPDLGALAATPGGAGMQGPPIQGPPGRLVANTHEIVQLQDELYAEVNRDAPHIARGIFGDTSQMPDIAQVSNQRLDDVYRQKYQSNDREWLQAEARRDPQQFLKVAERIGAKIPPPQPPAPAPPVPLPAPPPVAQAPMLPPAPPVPLVPSPLAAPGPVVVPSIPAPMQAGAPPPVILGPNGQPLAPSGAM